MNKLSLLVLILALAFITSFSNAENLRDFGPSPSFSGLDYHGNTFNSNDFLSNKVTLVNFFFTSCEGPCPSIMLKLNKLFDEFESCKNFQIISISVDPDVDSPQKLLKYSEDRGLINKNWHLLNVEESLVINLLNNGFKLGSGGDVINHSTRVVLIDTNSTIRALINPIDEAGVLKLKKSLHELCK